MTRAARQGKVQNEARNGESSAAAQTASTAPHAAIALALGVIDVEGDFAAHADALYAEMLLAKHQGR